MDTIQFNESEKELTIYKKPSKSTPLSFAGSKLKVDDIQNMIHYRARKRVFLYVSFILYCIQFFLNIMEVTFNTTTPFLINMVLWAGTLILFILYFAMPSFGMAVFTKNHSSAVIDITKAQIYEATRAVAALKYSRDSSNLGGCIQSKKVTIADKGSSILISGKCGIKTGLFYDSVVIGAEIAPSITTTITLKKRFNLLPILFILIGLASLTTTIVICSLLGRVMSSPIQDLLNLSLFLFSTLGYTTFVLLFTSFSVILIVIGLVFSGRIHNTVLMIKLSDKFILRCRLRARDYTMLHIILDNVKNYKPSTATQTLDRDCLDEEYLNKK